MAFAVIARYRCEPADGPTVRSALLEMRKHTLAEPGNLAYVVHADTEVPGAFVLYEQYTDRAAFDAHAAADHFAELILATVRPLLVERTVTFGEVI